MPRTAKGPMHPSRDFHFNLVDLISIRNILDIWKGRGCVSETIVDTWLTTIGNIVGICLERWLWIRGFEFIWFIYEIKAKLKFPSRVEKVLIEEREETVVDLGEGEAEIRTPVISFSFVFRVPLSLPTDRTYFYCISSWKLVKFSRNLLSNVFIPIMWKESGNFQT